jgi:type IX secretion system PorP/SprF family membrane protein
MEKQSRVFIHIKIMKKTKHILAFVIISILFTTAYAQEFPLYTQYMYGKNMINPGYVGVDGRMSLTLIHRSQWVGVEGAPTTSNLSFQYPFEKAAIGAIISRDIDGPVSKLTAKGQFSYNLELDYFTYLSLGVDFGIYNHQFDLSKLTIRDSEDIFSEDYNSIEFNAGIGAFLYSEEWYIGLSVPNLNLQKKYKSNSAVTDKHLLHTYLMAGYNFEMGPRRIIQPSMMLRYASDLPISAELTLNMKWNETLTTGIAYRFNSAYSLLVGIDITRKLHVGYAFDWDQSRFYRSNYGSHEAFLRYYLNTQENSARYQSPRFF